MEDSVPFDPKISLIAITGGPCAGKSTFMAYARQWLEDRGFCVGIIPEVATEFINAGFTPWGSWADPLAFQNHLLLYSLSREARYFQFARESSRDAHWVLLCDRGLLDPIAYVGRDQYVSVLERHGLDLHSLRERYKGVLHLVTAANGKEEFYTLANNTARTETPEEARLLDQRTQAAWFGHQHLTIIDNTTHFEVKIERALTSLARVLNMPEPLEIERKFKVLNFIPGMIPHDAVRVDIEQDYLLTDKERGERRVRKRVLDGGASYYYTEKVDTGRLGERIERERQISLVEYDELLREKDPLARTIRKQRFCFAFSGRHLELDYYSELESGPLVILEVEVRDINEVITLPEGWLVEDVTSEKRFKNREIAFGSL